MLKIDKIWMEIELWFPWWNCRDHDTFFWVNYANKWGMNISNRFWFKTSVSKEYYKNQVEFNIPWTKNKWIDMRHKVACLCDKFPEESFTVSLKGPAYVWTHIHYSFLDNNWEPINYPIRNKVLILMLNIICFYIDYFQKKIRLTKQSDKFLVYPTLRNEIERLVKNHNILINRDTKVFDRRIESFLISNWNWFIYTNGRDNIRYRPIIWSPARPWKPFTMEIRYISNLIWLDQKEITVFNKMVETIMNSHNEYKTKADLEKLKDKIFEKYKELYSIYNSLSDWKADKESTNLMTINMYQKWIAWKKLCLDSWKYNIYVSKNSQSDNLKQYSIWLWEYRFIVQWLKNIIINRNKKDYENILEIISKFKEKNKIKYPIVLCSGWEIRWSEDDIDDKDDIIKCTLRNTYVPVQKPETNSSFIKVQVLNVVTWEKWYATFSKKIMKRSYIDYFTKPKATPIVEPASIWVELWNRYEPNVSYTIDYCWVRYRIFFPIANISSNISINNVYDYISWLQDIRETLWHYHPHIDEAIIGISTKLHRKILVDLWPMINNSLGEVGTQYESAQVQWQTPVVEETAVRWGFEEAASPRTYSSEESSPARIRFT